MQIEKIVKFDQNLEKNTNLDLNILNFQNKMEIELKLVNCKIEALKKKIDEQHLENIHSDEILIKHFRNITLPKT